MREKLEETEANRGKRQKETDRAESKAGWQKGVRIDLAV